LKQPRRFSYYSQKNHPGFASYSQSEQHFPEAEPGQDCHQCLGKGPWNKECASFAETKTQSGIHWLFSQAGCSGSNREWEGHGSLVSIRQGMGPIPSSHSTPKSPIVRYISEGDVSLVGTDVQILVKINHERCRILGCVHP